MTTTTTTTTYETLVHRKRSDGKTLLLRAAIEPTSVRLEVLIDGAIREQYAGTTSIVLQPIEGGKAPYTALPRGTYYSYGCGILPLEEAQAVLARLENLKADAAERLERVVPGLQEARAARDAESEYSDAHRRMMEDEANDGVRPPTKPATRYRDVAARYPRAALYLAAESQRDHASWSDPTGRAEAAKECVRLLEAGADLAECQAALNRRRRSYVD